jgi:hypothetical protein
VQSKSSTTSTCGVRNFSIIKRGNPISSLYIKLLIRVVEENHTLQPTVIHIMTPTPTSIMCFQVITDLGAEYNEPILVLQNRKDCRGLNLTVTFKNFNRPRFRSTAKYFISQTEKMEKPILGKEVTYASICSINRPVKCTTVNSNHNYYPWP